MRSASRLFYLSVFALWASPAACDAQNDCAISPKSIVEDACASYATLDQLNSRVKPVVDDLTRTTDFFSHYRLNLFNKQCPFWDDDGGICGNIGCAVETLDNEEDVPEVWRARELSKLEGPLAKHPGRKAKQNPQRPLQGGLGDNVGESCVFEYDDECDERDYCVPEDERTGSKGDYVSLLNNQERFTGYGGEGAHQIWDAIYRENCFSKSSFPHSANLGSGSGGHDFKQVLAGASRGQHRQHSPVEHLGLATASAAFETDDQCLEKRVFYRVMSGMHASISAHLCWDFLNQTTGKWQPNPSCYASRLHAHPDRISNLYFNYALVTRAVAKLGPYLQTGDYTFCTGDPTEDAATRAKVLEVTSSAASEPQIFDEGLMFVNGEGPSLKEDFRNRFRNVSRLMDCVGCDKCRLWGKVQTAGYGAALKVLFEIDNNSDDIPTLKRTELVALFNTYARISESLHVVDKFRAILASGEEPSSPVVEDIFKVEDTPVADERSEEEIQQERIAAAKKRRGMKKTTTGERFSREFSLVLKAFKLVINSWIRFPITLWEIVSSEAVRFGQFWVGRPVNERKWRVELPVLNRDEL